MSTNKSQQDVSIDDDAELLALEELLCQAETNKEVVLAPTIEKAVPRLREDSTFADAFSYEVDAETAKAADRAWKPEDLDSSDDEEVRNFLERKYNEYGSDINKKLKQQRETALETSITNKVNADLKQANSKPAPQSTTTTVCHVKNPHNPVKRQSMVSNSFQKTVTPQARNTNATPVIAASAVFTDPVFSLRIINPLISSALLVERMSGRLAVPFSGIAFHVERGDLAKDWVIAGALVNKSAVRMSKKGDPFSTWRISDLRGEVKTVTIFLFKGAHKALWKTAEGMCVAVLNPSVFEKRAGTADVACLSIDNAQKVMVLGQSKDFGICKAMKKNGDKCTSIVNLSECDYCIYHMKQEFGKMSRRSELQSATSGRGLHELRNKVLGKSEVFYGGQSYSALPARKSAKMTAKDNNRLSNLSEYSVSPYASSINHTSKPRIASAFDSVPYAARDGRISKVAGNVDATAKQRQKDLERLKILQAENEKFKTATTTINTSTPSLSTPSTAQIDIATDAPIVPEKFKNREFSFVPKSTPKLSSENFCIEVNLGARRAQAAKLKAAQLLKKKPLEKINPNSTRGSLQGKRRAIDELNEKYLTMSDAKRQRTEETDREMARKSRIERIMAATSSHANLIDLREQEEQSQYFNKLEKKEALEEKMLSTFKMPCKAVICQLCKYTAFSAAERCKLEKHPLKIVDAEKRFFQCKDCGNRTTSVFKMPKLSCSNCKGSAWQRAAMIRERIVGIGQNVLSIRGDEETFVGSTTGSANLNLLVPDE